MSIDRPTADDIAALAARLGYHSAMAVADQYAAIITDLLDAYDVVDTIDHVPPRTRARRPARVVVIDSRTRARTRTTPGTSRPASPAPRRGRSPARRSP